MSALRRIASTATDVVCRIAGRRQVVRAARFVLHRARLDIPNDLRFNGESSLQRWMLEISPAGQEIHVLDVGANVGRWSDAIIVAARQLGRLDDLDLHAFEPSTYTFARLSEALDGRPVSLHRVALGEKSGSAALHVMAPGAGTNSLYEPTTSQAVIATEEVTATTLDAYAYHAGLDLLTLVKVDTEGHDLSVLRGAQNLFAEQRILAAQFEYNHRWIAARSFLRDAFELLAPLGYRLGKLTPHGVEFYPGWDAELETFVEGNYVACVPELVNQLPSVAWWKSSGKGVPR
jgi:FkbM family methyltransferase